jgi:nitrogen regulatory protein PII
MQAVFIVFNQGITEEITEILEALKIRGYTQWNEVMGRGTVEGEPRMGSHTWPALNNAILIIIENEKVKEILQKVDQLNKDFPEQGLRAFSWDIKDMV